LETDRLIFRGSDFRLEIPFKEVRSVESRAGRLEISYPRGKAVFELGLLAEKWAEKIRHPKSLLDKLGIKPRAIVAVLGIQDGTFLHQLRERTSFMSKAISTQNYDQIFLLAEEKRHLKKLKSLKRMIKREGAIWIVSPKGNQHIREDDILAAGRDAGLVDVKVVAFSATHTAHKFVIPAAKR